MQSPSRLLPEQPELNDEKSDDALVNSEISRAQSQKRLLFFLSQIGYNKTEAIRGFLLQCMNSKINDFNIISNILEKQKRQRESWSALPTPIASHFVRYLDAITRWKLSGVSKEFLKLMDAANMQNTSISLVCNGFQQGYMYLTFFTFFFQIISYKKHNILNCFFCDVIYL